VDFEEVKKKPIKKTHMQRQRKKDKTKKTEEKQTTITTTKNYLKFAQYKP
jgi:hypothetical protein